MSEPFKEFVEELARLTVPEDDTDESRGRRETAASESGVPIGELDESDLIASADDEFLWSEALALWAMIRKARALVGAGREAILGLNGNPRARDSAAPPGAGCAYVGLCHSVQLNCSGAGYIWSR
jgi:hypothetical protein